MRGAFYILVFCVGSLLMMGLVMLYSASMAQDGAGLLVSQLKWGGLGLVACLLLASIDYQALKRFHIPALLAGFAALLLILVARQLADAVDDVARHVDDGRRRRRHW